MLRDAEGNANDRKGWVFRNHLLFQSAKLLGMKTRRDEFTGLTLIRRPCPARRGGRKARSTQFQCQQSTYFALKSANDAVLPM